MTLTKLTLFTVAVAGFGQGCARSGTAYAPPPPLKVDESTYQGEPGEFAALYSGTCTAQSATHVYSDCTTRVRIRHRGGSLEINTQFVLTTTDAGKAQWKQLGRDLTLAVLSGKQLLRPSSTEIIGTVGERGFEIKKESGDYHFARLYPNTYEYAGTFAVDGTGEVVELAARLKRGPPDAESALQ